MEDPREALADALYNQAPMRNLREEFGPLLRSNEFLSYRQGVSMQPLALAIQQACGNGYHNDEYHIERLRFLVTECGINPNTPFIIRGSPEPNTSGRTVTVQVAIPASHESNYSIHTTPLSRAIRLMADAREHDSRLGILFIMELITLGADPQWPFHHITTNQLDASDDQEWNQNDGQSILWQTIQMRGIEDRNFDLCLFLLEHESGFLPSDGAAITSLAEHGWWDFIVPLLRAFAPFYSPQGTLFSQREFAPSPVEGCSPLHYLAAFVPQNLAIMQEAFHLLVDVYGQSITQETTTLMPGRTPLDLLGTLNPPNTQSSNWLRQTLQREMEFQLRRNAITLKHVFNKKTSLPSEIQNHIAQASLAPGRRFLMSNAERAIANASSRGRLFPPTE